MKNWKLIFNIGVLGVVLTAFILVKYTYQDVQIEVLNPIRDKALLQKLQKKDTSDPRVKRILSTPNIDSVETIFLPASIVLRLGSLGWESFSADILFIRAHSYFLSHMFYDRRFPWLKEYYRAIKALDPYIPRLYLWIAEVLLFGQNIDNKVVMEAVNYLKEGIKYFPEEPKFYEEIGFDLYFEYRGKDLVDKQMMRIKGREYLAKAATLPGSDLDPNLVAQLYMEKSENKLALYYALIKYFEAKKFQKEQLLYRISMLAGEMAVNLKKLEDRWKREFPFVNPDLFALIEDRLRVSKELLQLEIRHAR